MPPGNFARFPTARLLAFVVSCSLWMLSPRTASSDGYVVAGRCDTPTWGGPTSLAVADVDGDLIPDLVEVNSANRTLSVFKGDGAGGTVSRVDFQTAFNPLSLVLRDLNGDGHPDAAVACASSNSIAVLFGNGAGGFAPRIEYATALQPRFLTSADMNGDGKPDLIVANRSAASIGVYLNDGAGAFPTHTDYPTVNGPASIALADVDGDGDLDAAVAGYFNHLVSYMPGNGSGGFGAGTNYGLGAGGSASSMLLEDTNGDGKLDMVFSVEGQNKVRVMRGDGTGAFVTTLDLATGPAPYVITTADLAGDGRRVLVVANGGGTTLSVFRADGAGGWSAARVVDVGSGPDALLTTDWDGDGIGDILVANANDNSISYLKGSRQGDFAAATPVADSGGPFMLRLGDMNEDGLADLAVTHYDAGTVSIALGLAAGGFAAPTTYATGPGTRAVRLADVDLDGHLDAVVTEGDADKVSILRGDGTGALGAKTSFPTPRVPTDVAVADLNEDGLPDLAVTNYISTLVSVWFATAPGVFGARTDLATATAGGLTGIWVGDFSGDGNVDIAASSSGSGGAILLYGDGTGGFPSQALSPSAWNAQQIDSGDLNGDGLPDLVISNGASSSVSLQYGDGGGSVFYAVDLHTGGTANGVAIGDLNGDGHPDVAVACAGSDSLAICFWNPACNSWFVQRRPVGINPVGVVIGDVNADGRPDVVTADYVGNTITISPSSSPSLAIVHSPPSRTVCSPASTTFSVAAFGPGLGYQWRRDGIPVSDGAGRSGSNTTTLSLDAVFPSDAGSYDVVVTNASGEVTSAAATLAVCTVPPIELEPSDRTVVLGEGMDFSATMGPACDDPTLRWHKDGIALTDGGRLSGTATDHLAITGLQFDDEGYYSLTATNACGTRTTRQARLRVLTCPDPPTITADPIDVTVPDGSGASFLVEASGCVSPTYQWLKGGHLIQGATAATFEIASVTPSDHDFYRAVVTAGGVSAMSKVAVLNIDAPVFVRTTSTSSQGAGCASIVLLTWQTNIAVDIVVEYEFTNAPSFPAILQQSAPFTGASSGSLSLPCPPGFRFLCYRIRATDAANRTAVTADRMLTLPSTGFTVSQVVPSVLAAPYATTLSIPGDAVGLGVQVANENCSSIGARVVIDQATLKLAQPKTAAGGVALPAIVATTIGAKSTVRMPIDFKFKRSEIGSPAGTTVTFSGRMKIESIPPSSRQFTARVRIP